MATLLATLMVEPPHNNQNELWKNIQQQLLNKRVIIQKPTEIPSVLAEAVKNTVTNNQEFDEEFWEEQAPKILLKRYYLTLFV